ASRAAELQLATRNQITNLPVSTPSAGGDEPRGSAIEIQIEAPRPIQSEVPRTIGKPAAVSLAPEAAPLRPPRALEQVAVAIPSAPTPIPQLEVPLPKMQQAEAQTPSAPPIASAKMQVAFVPAPQPLTSGELAVAPASGSLAS